jgi:hypothetical protein
MDEIRIGIIGSDEMGRTCFAIDEAADSGTVVDLQPYWGRVDS